MPKPYSFDAEIIDVTAGGTADTEFSVTHTLARVPLESFVVWRSQNSVIYRGTTAWTTTTIWLRASVASTTFRIWLT